MHKSKTSLIFNWYGFLQKFFIMKKNEPHKAFPSHLFAHSFFQTPPFSKLSNKAQVFISLAKVWSFFLLSIVFETDYIYIDRLISSKGFVNQTSSNYYYYSFQLLLFSFTKNYVILFLKKEY